MAISKVVYKSSASAQGVTWIDATPATAEAADIISPQTAMLADGVVTQGTGSGGITPTGNINITQAGQTDVTNYATATVASGTAGTPTATKGAVSNHSVTVTPSVTNSAGYIDGGTKTGTGVQVTVAELESGTKSITQNGTGIDVSGYSAVDVSVASSVSYDTKTVTASNYPVSLEFTGMKGQPKAFVLRLNTSVSSSGSTTYYYIVDIAAFGETTHGNCFRIGSTRQVTTLSSGYSWSYSGTTLTVTSSAASRSASPGAFYSGSYELVYCY